MEKAGERTRMMAGSKREMARSRRAHGRKPFQAGGRPEQKEWTFKKNTKC
jgi:hypothetical protein